VAVVDVATGSFVVDTTTSSTSYTANLTAGKVYRWNVAAGNSAGQSSFTTPALYFQTPSATNTKPTVSLTSPIGGESWAVGTAHNITATITGSVTGWILEVSTDSGQTWATITTTNVASAGIIFAWTVPNTVTTNARVRATVTYSGGSAQSSSAADFSITAALSSGFTNGMRVMAQQGGIYVRDPQLNRLGSTAFAYDQSGGAHGTIVGTPIQGSADGNTGPWWYVNFDAGWNGYCAQSVIAAAPLAGDVPKPSLTSNAYASLNPFWRGGYAPASVPQPPSVANQLGGALGNCTWYAYGRALELGADATALQAVALGNAYQWAANSAPDNSPVPGAIAVKGADSNFPLGHVAVVESVNAGGSITVTESSATTNSQSPWYFLWRHRTLFSNDPVWGWSSSATTNGFRFIHLATSAPVQYTVTPSVTTAAGGTISPVSAEKVASGGSVNFTASAAAGYSVGQWLVNGVSAQLGGSNFTLSNITTDQTVQVVFAPNTAAGLNPSYAAIADQIKKTAAKYHIPSVIVAAVMWKESQWSQFDSTGNVLTGPTGDIGIMQINVNKPALAFDANLIKTDWITNLDVGCQILQQKFQIWGVFFTDPLETRYDTYPSILENWYYPVAWYNGSGDQAYNYVNTVWSYIKGAASSPLNSYFTTIPSLGTPTSIPGFPTTITTSLLGLTNLSSSQLVALGAYTLLILDQNGQKIHLWDWNTSTASDITQQIAGSGPGPIPGITSAATATGIVGQSFKYQITGSNAPASFSAASLPSGLSVDPASGWITGTPSAAGTFLATIIASNGSGNGTASLTITVKPANPFAGTYRGSLTDGSGFWGLSADSSGNGTYISYLGSQGAAIVQSVSVDWSGQITMTSMASAQASGAPNLRVLAIGETQGERSLNPAISNFSITGQIANGTVTGQISGFGVSFSGTADTAAGPAQGYAGFYSASAVSATNGTTYALVAASGQAIVVMTTPTSVDGGLGTVNANGQIAATTVSGATISGSINQSNQSISTAVTSSAAGSSTISYQGVSATVSTANRLVNISTRGFTGTGSQVLIAGFVINGSSAKQVLVRGIGPTLTNFGVTGVLANPRLALYDANGSLINENIGWGTSGNASDVAQTAASVGAFALPAGSKDSTLLVTLNPGLYSAIVSGSDGGSGISLIEVYETDSSSTATKLINISSRGQVNVGSGALIAGFVVTGNAPKKILLRGVGPTLASFGVTGVLADPILTLFDNSGNTIAQNDNWGSEGDGPDIITVSNQVGAFALPTGSKDAVLLVTLTPGLYTMQVSGTAGSTGVALVEVYEVPQ
jgi:surface antigen